MWGRQWTGGTIIFVAMIMSWDSAIGQVVDPTVSLYVRNELCGDIEPGSKVRLLVGSGHNSDDLEASEVETVLTGTIETCRDGVLILRPARTGADSVLVPLEHVLSLEVSHGKSSYVLQGAGIGLLVGLGISMAAQTDHHEDEFLGGLSDMEDNINRGVGITIVTTLVGGVMGAALGSEKWDSVYNLQVGGSYGSGQQGEYQVAVGFSF